ncbi:MAG: dihydrolipoyl dehydrogenase [Planctomycetota bacterium]|nr:MAG: dihydrolipoyl dehydrogenase [Planctomycetota bacterium]
MTHSDDSTQLVVIGAGPGGYPAAFAAADKGIEVTLVNDEPIPGGVCLHRGCIPSKALLHLARLIHEANEVADCGVFFGPPRLDVEKIRAWKDSVVTKLTGGIRQLAEKRGVRYVQARARFVDPRHLELTHPDGSRSRLEFEHAIVATGSRPTIPAAFRLDDPRVMDSTGALQLADVPRRLLVVGGGYIGLEMGSVYAALGSRVTVVEMTSGLLPGADRDLVRPLQRRLESLFHAIRCDTKVLSLSSQAAGVGAKLESDGTVERQVFDRVLIAIGRRPNTEDVGLDAAGVQVDPQGFVVVDEQRRTTQRHIFAIGDVAGQPMLAHKATREAHVAVDALAGEPAAFDNRAIPAVVFTDPEVAWVGLTETEARRRGIAVKVSRFPWAASGRAQSIGRPEGMTKVLVDPDTERVLGVGIVGVGAGELIAEAALAVEMGVEARDISDTIHAHPTLAETLMEAAEGIFGVPTHVYRPRS